MNTLPRIVRYLLACATVWLLSATEAQADDWSRWRGDDGSAVADAKVPPASWSSERNIVWKARIDGEGSSSPVVIGDRVYITSSRDEGTVRLVHALDAVTGRTLWTGRVDDKNPENTSALTGHAAATPVADGGRVVASFGNAGVVCFDAAGKRLWRKDLGRFETELGLASSPIAERDRVILVCDHDGNRFRNFDSYVMALDLKTGRELWKTERPKLGRSWSTPIVVTTPAGDRELIVSGDEQLRGYDPATGKMLWHVRGLGDWVTPSPVFADGVVYAASGPSGPILAVRPGGKGDVADSHVVWKHAAGGPYVTSPLVYRGRLYIHSRAGVLTCYRAASGKELFKKRLEGRFTSSGVGGAGKIYLTNEAGRTWVLAAADEFKLLSKNDLNAGESLASPAIADGSLFIRCGRELYRIGKK